MIFLLALTLAFASSASASVAAPVPQAALRHFVSEGFFEGGDPRPAVLGSVDVTQLPREDVERWMISFAGEGAPRFRLHYEAPQTFIQDDGSEGLRRAGRFVLVFRALRRSLVAKAALVDAVRRSRFVSEAVLYPPLEDGDTALELLLRGPVRFEPFQPAGRDGRLVLDIVGR